MARVTLVGVDATMSAVRTAAGFLLLRQVSMTES
jgi:hypothetical protein